MTRIAVRLLKNTSMLKQFYIATLILAVFVYLNSEIKPLVAKRPLFCDIQPKRFEDLTDIMLT